VDELEDNLMRKYLAEVRAEFLGDLIEFNLVTEEERTPHRTHSLCEPPHLP
jgi:hypothetical protein